MGNKPKVGEKIIQIMNLEGNLLGLSSDGNIYRAMLSGDLSSDKNFWQPFIDSLINNYKDEL